MRVALLLMTGCFVRPPDAIIRACDRIAEQQIPSAGQPRSFGLVLCEGTKCVCVVH